MPKVTKVNYSVDQIATMKAMYSGDNSKIALTLIAEKVGKTVPSVRAKMSAEGFYKPNEKVVTESTRIKKSDTVSVIAGLVGGLSEADQDGLSKSTAAPLAKIVLALTNKNADDAELAALKEAEINASMDESESADSESGTDFENA